MKLRLFVVLAILFVSALAAPSFASSGGANCPLRDYPGLASLVDACVTDGAELVPGTTYAILVDSGIRFTLEGGSLEWRAGNGWQGGEGWHLQVNVTNFPNVLPNEDGSENWSGLFSNYGIYEEAQLIVPLGMSGPWALFEVTGEATSSLDIDEIMSNVAEVAITDNQTVADSDDALVPGVTYAIVAGRSFVVSYNGSDYTVQFQVGWGTSYNTPVEVFFNGAFTTAYPDWNHNRAAHTPHIVDHQVMVDGTVIIIFEIIDQTPR